MTVRYFPLTISFSSFHHPSSSPSPSLLALDPFLNLLFEDYQLKEATAEALGQALKTNHSLTALYVPSALSLLLLLLFPFLSSFLVFLFGGYFDESNFLMISD